MNYITTHDNSINKGRIHRHEDLLRLYRGHSIVNSFSLFIDLVTLPLPVDYYWDLTYTSR